MSLHRLFKDAQRGQKCIYTIITSGIIYSGFYAALQLYFIFTQLCKDGPLINALIWFWFIALIVQIQYKCATLLIMWITAWLQLFNLIAVIILSFKVTYLIQIRGFNIEYAVQKCNNELCCECFGIMVFFFRSQTSIKICATWRI